MVVELVLPQLAPRGPRQLAQVAREDKMIVRRHVSPPIGVGFENVGAGVAHDPREGMAGLRTVQVARTRGAGQPAARAAVEGVLWLHGQVASG